MSVTRMRVVFQLPLEAWRGAPHGLALGPDGAIWFSLPTSEPSIDRFQPGAGLSAYPIPGGGGTFPNSVSAGADQAVWFSQFWPAVIGRVTPNGELSEWPTGTYPYGDPQSLLTGPDGAEWFVESQPPRIGRITTTGQVSEFPIPGAEATTTVPLSSGPEGALWFAFADAPTGRQSGGVSLGRITTAGVITELPLPGVSPGASPVSLAAGPEGDLWLATIDPAALVQINPQRYRARRPTALTPRSAPDTARSRRSP